MVECSPATGGRLLLDRVGRCKTLGGPQRPQWSSFFLCLLCARHQTKPLMLGEASDAVTWQERGMGRRSVCPQAASVPRQRPPGGQCGLGLPWCCLTLVQVSFQVCYEHDGTTWTSLG